MQVFVPREDLSLDVIKQYQVVRTLCLKHLPHLFPSSSQELQECSGAACPVWFAGVPHAH